MNDLISDGTKSGSFGTVFTFLHISVLLFHFFPIYLPTYLDEKYQVIGRHILISVLSYKIRQILASWTTLEGCPLHLIMFQASPKHNLMGVGCSISSMKQGVWRYL